jgi:hypothetical protein
MTTTTSHHSSFPPVKLRIARDQISDPLKFRRLNGWLVIFWGLMFPISVITGMMSMVAYVTLLSLYANFATHLGSWAAARAEARQAEDASDRSRMTPCPHCGGTP